MVRASEDKFTKYRFLRRSSTISAHLPETHMLTFSSFHSMLKKYREIIVKPIGKGGGFGVIKITTLGKKKYLIHLETRKKVVKGIKTTYFQVKKLTKGLSYLVQRYIPLAKINHRPFDVRVIVQRKKGSRTWSVTGTAAKIAGKGYIVTNNTRSKGTLIPLPVALQKTSFRPFHKQLMTKMKKTAIKIANRMNLLYPQHRIYGLDMGISKKGRIYLIEANKYPSLSHFIKLKDFSTYKRIQRIKKG